MPLALRSATKSYASIDDLLGDGHRRFFSHGYKSTNPRLHELRVAHTVSESTLSARAGLGVEGGRRVADIASIFAAGRIAMDRELVSTGA